MSNIYEIIEAIMTYKDITLREVSEKTKMPYTTCASMLARRSARLPKPTLSAIASALGVEFDDIVPPEAALHAIGISIPKYPTDCSVEFRDSVLSRIIGDNFKQFLPESSIRKSRNLPTRNAPPAFTHSNDNRRQFMQSFNFVLNKLNDDGLMEVMRHMLNIIQDPKYCVNTEFTAIQEDEQ